MAETFDANIINVSRKFYEYVSSGEFLARVARYAFDLYRVTLKQVFP